MFNVGPGELVAILALALVVLGPNRLPEAVRTAGRVVGEVRRITSGFQQELRGTLEDAETGAEPEPDGEDDDVDADLDADDTGAGAGTEADAA